MKHYFSTRVRVVLLIAVLLAVALGVTSSLTDLSVPNLLVKGVLTPLRSGASQLVQQAERLYDYIFDYESISTENEDLKEQIAQLEEDARQVDAVLRENERLRALLELTKTHEDFVLVDGYVISWSSTEWSSTFTINRGSNAGIKEGMCAITANGELVGLVSEVGSNYSVIKTVLDSSLEIHARIASSAAGYKGMVRGGYSTGIADKLRMDYLSSSAVIRKKDQVVTAGSTIYPRDLVVGHVEKVGVDVTGVAKYAILEPAADMGSLEQVFIITEYNAG